MFGREWEHADLSAQAGEHDTEDPGRVQASSEPAWRVAERYGISEQTVWKWRGRDDVHDRSHRLHRL